MGVRSFRDELDPAFRERQWRVQRAGWLLMLAIVLGAIAGIFGTSPLASQVVTADAGTAHYEVEYPRFARYENMERLHLRVHAPDAQGDELTVAFSNEFVENAAIQGTTPDPDGGGVGPDGPQYAFKVDDWSDLFTVTFSYEPRKSFRFPGEVTVTAGDQEPVRLGIDAFVYP